MEQTLRTRAAYWLPGLAVLLTGGCGSREDAAEGDLSKIAKATLGKEEIEKLAQEKGVPGLRPLLKSEKSENRMLAILALGNLKGNEEATQLLVELAKGPDPEHAQFAILALGIQGGPQPKQVIEEIITKSDDPHRRAAACRAIYEMVVRHNDKSLAPLLDTALSDEDPKVRSAAKAMKRNIEHWEARATTSTPTQPEP